MPRTKSESRKDTINKSEMKDHFMNCKAFTQDQLSAALAEVCRRENVSEESTQRISRVLDSVISDGFSRFMASAGM